VDAHEQAVAVAHDLDRVVVVLRRAGIDRERAAAAQVAALAGRRRRVGRQGGDLGEHVVREVPRGAALGRERVHHGLEVARRAEPLEDARPPAVRRGRDERQLACRGGSAPASPDGQRQPGPEEGLGNEVPPTGDENGGDHEAESISVDLAQREPRARRVIRAGTDAS
jgi:hypothetical protein